MEEKNVAVNNLQLKSRKLVFEIYVLHNATPASVTATTDLPGVCVLGMEGVTSPLTSVEAVSALTNYTAPDASDGILDVMLKGSELGSIAKVQSIKVSEKVAAGLTSPTVQILGSANGLTPGGNIAFEIDTATNLETTDAKFVCEVDYMLA